MLDEHILRRFRSAAPVPVVSGDPVDRPLGKMASVRWLGPGHGARRHPLRRCDRGAVEKGRRRRPGRSPRVPGGSQLLQPLARHRPVRPPERPRPGGRPGRCRRFRARGPRPHDRDHGRRHRHRRVAGQHRRRRLPVLCRRPRPLPDHRWANRGHRLRRSPRHANPLRRGKQQRFVLPAAARRPR